MESKNREQIIFKQNTKEQDFLFYSGISFGLLAQNAILQRTSDFMPLDILSFSACLNFHISCEKLLKFILNKFEINCAKNETISNLFFMLPKYIQNQILSNINFQTKYLTLLPSIKNLEFYENNSCEILQIFNFLNNFQKRIEAISMDIEQNNLFV